MMKTGFGEDASPSAIRKPEPQPEPEPEPEAKPESKAGQSL
jgi:hypothetical protein